MCYKLGHWHDEYSSKISLIEWEKFNDIIFYEKKRTIYWANIEKERVDKMV